MFSKLALKNVRKSIKDYTIYFLTVAFGVCLFYLFNSLDSQTAMLQLNESKYNCLKALTTVISYISIFVAVVLGFLIVYANQFLIKRRKKELGLYMTLGMPKGKIARLLSLETLLIGIFALAVGLVAGIFLSQGFSVVTAKIFEVNMKSFQFVFSPHACEKTLLYFGIMFLVVILFNALSISHLKLIDLLTAEKKNETLKVKKLWISVVLFLVSICCLVVAYYLVNKSGIFNMGSYEFIASIILGIVGTFLFFFSLSGFLLRVIKSNKKLYYKGLNLFILRQFSSKINTTFVSVSVICLMLLITIGTLSCGMGIANTLSQAAKSMTPYDASLVYLSHDGKKPIDMVEGLKKDKIDIHQYASEIYQADSYQIDKKIADFHIDQKTLADIIGSSSKEMLEQAENSSVEAITLNDYNHLAKMQGKAALTLADDEFAIAGNFDKAKTPLDNFLQNEGMLQLKGKTYKAGQKQVISFSLLTSMSSPSDIVILPDAAVTGFSKNIQVLNINYKRGVTDEQFLSALKNVYSNEKMKDYKGNPPYDSSQTRQKILDQGAGVTAIASYVAIYIGLVFLIAGAAILALQQLSESSDNTGRYALLRKLGADEHMMRHALFTQIGLYFLLPLSLAIVHSIVGIHVANKQISLLGNMNNTSSSLMTVLIFVVIYGGYFLATYFGSRSILRNRNSSD